MTFDAYFKALRDCELIAQDKWFPLQLAQGMLPAETDWDNPMKLLAWYFVLQERGNIYMSLNEDILQKKLTELLNAQKAYFVENGVAVPSDFAKLEDEIPTVLSGLGQMNTMPIVGEKALFLIEKNRLYARKYLIAKDSVAQSVDRLFVDKYECLPSPLSYESAVDPNFRLTELQKDIIVLLLRNFCYGVRFCFRKFTGRSYGTELPLRKPFGGCHCVGRDFRFCGTYRKQYI